MSCPFCASGRSGFLRNLSCDELWQQLEAARVRGLHPQRITISGIGEPLQNPVAVESFIEEARGRGLAVSLTTTGLPLTRLRSFLGLPHNGLMISIHAGSSEVHRKLVPKGPSFDEFWEMLKNAWPALSGNRRRKIGINYLLLAGHNDSQRELSALSARLAPHPEITLHVLTANPVPGSPFSSPDASRVAAAWEYLRQKGIHVRRANRWRSIGEGGCGTLVASQTADSYRGFL